MPLDVISALPGAFFVFQVASEYIFVPGISRSLFSVSPVRVHYGTSVTQTRAAPVLPLNKVQEL
jgi:hypothetical protein